MLRLFSTGAGPERHYRMEHYLDGVSKRSLPVMRSSKVTDFSPAMKARFLDRGGVLQVKDTGMMEKWREFDGPVFAGPGNDRIRPVPIPVSDNRIRKQAGEPVNRKVLRADRVNP